jgi:23S rRNA pseudouridine2605 synthase
METEKKPKRPRIGMPANSDPNDTESRYEKVNYPLHDENHQNADQQSTGAQRPAHQNRNYTQGYQRPYNNNYRQGGGYQQRPYNNYQQGYNRNFQEQDPANATSEKPAEGAEEQTHQSEDNNFQQRQNYQQRSYNPNYRQNNNYQGGYNNNRQGGYNNNRQNYNPNRQNYNQNRQNYNNNRQGGYNQGYQQGGYNQGYNQGYNNQGGYNQGGYNQGGYNNHQGGYNNRQGNFNNNRQGGYNNRQGNFNNRQGGYNNNRQGNFNNNRQGYNKPRFTPRPRQVEYAVEELDPNTEIRLNKYLSNAGLCSRREADERITNGLIKVNGNVVSELGSKIKPGDVVEFDGKVVVPERKCYVLLNKPKDCVTTTDDESGRTTVLDIVKNACRERIYPVGRLDRNTTGVLLLTNDGDLASKLTHPKYIKKKIYHVWTDKAIAEEDMQRIADGIELDDGEIHADAISYVNDSDKNQAGIEIHSGRNRIVRRIFETLGYRVVKLDRVYFAGLTKKNLPRGKWRYLTQEEVNYLKMGSFE